MDIALLIYDDMTALDLVGPLDVMALMPDAELKIAGLKKGPVRAGKGKCSFGVVADYGLADIARADVLIVPGGMGSRVLIDDKAVTGWIAKIHETTVWTTSVCTGSLLLAAAGVLKDVPATTHWAAMELLGKLGAKPVSRRVVEEGKIITAAGVSSGIDMALTLAAKIHGEDIARAIQLLIEYDPEPPFDSGNAGTVTPEIRKLAGELMTAR